ncbi:MAG: prolipoprotein diacylglyceryl transferase [Planctomycetes bacterium]|nr:prolipoprotein diacylglyceryl transferase [Planctomycetota bacterium]
MHPVLFRIPGLNWPVNSYGFMIMLGFLLATWIAVRRGRAIGVKSDLLLDIGIISMIAGILGAKINYILQYQQDIPGAMDIFDVGDGGMNWLGGLILGPVPFLFWWWRIRRRGEQHVRLFSWQNGVLLASTLVFALIGTRALHLILHRKDYNWVLFETWQSGFVLYGGLVAGILAGALYAKMRRASVLQLADLAAAPIMIGVAFGRVGCFLNGCCYGKPTEAWLGVRFPKGSASYAEHGGQAVHPTQLYETAATLLIFAALSWYAKHKKRRDGEVVLLLGVLYPAWRFFVEFLRDDPRPKWLGPLSYSQTLSLVFFLLCGAAWFMLRTRALPTVESRPSSR